VPIHQEYKSNKPKFGETATKEKVALGGFDL
jgi:hypothetical protein